MYTPDAELLDTAIQWCSAGHDVQLVTVVSTWGSAPRPPGAIAIVRDDGVIAGSVSGGCIERTLARQAGGGDDNNSSGIRTIAISDAVARGAGLTCGGQLDLLFETLDDVVSLRVIVDAINAREQIVRELDTTTGIAKLRTTYIPEAFHWDGERLSRPFGPGWRLLLIGAGELSRHVASVATLLDFDVVICEPRVHFREAFGVPSLQPIDTLPDDAVSAYARDPRSAVLALSHDPALDDLALEEALQHPCFHIGALGSRQSHRRRCERLHSMGIEAATLERISAPVGVDIGSRSAAEIAVSIAAELVQVRALARGRAGGT